MARLRRPLTPLTLCGILALLLLLAPPAAAQKRTADPRPLSGLDRSRFPAYASPDAFARAHPGGDLRAAARPAGTSAFAARSLPMQTAQRAAAAAPGAPAFAPIRIQRAPNGTVRWMQGTLDRLGPAPAGKRAAAAHVTAAATGVLDRYAPVLGLADPAAELRPVRTDVDALGSAHARFEQVYEGVPVWGRDLYVHVDAGGEVYAVNGTYEPTPTGVETTPTVAAGAARDVVERDLRARGRWAPVSAPAAQHFGMEDGEPRLVVYPGAAGPRLAWEVSLHPNLVEWYSYLVDAHTGAVLHRLARHCSARPTDPNAPPPDAAALHLPETHGPAAASAAAGTFLDAQGVALDGAARTFRAYRHDNGHHYLVWDLPNLDAGTFSFPNPSRGGIMTYSAGGTDGTEEGQILMVNSADNAWRDASAVSAHHNARVLYDYYRTTFDRDAIDGKDATILSVINVTQGGQPMDNAYWNGRFMAYGDGAEISKPWAGAVDLTGHEMTHGVIEHSAGLIYQFQSGALNESFADVFAVLLDPEDFFLFEDITLPSFGPAFRDLLNPDNAALQQPQPAHMKAYLNLTINQDNGGVHINSGIPNRAAALLMQAIGHDKVAQIYYRALTTYLTRNSQFGDARNAVVQAARDLYGENSTEAARAGEAFDAVGITAETGTGGDAGNDLPPQSGGRSLVTFLLEDGSIGLMDLTDGSNVQIGVFSDPAARARVTPDMGDWAQLSVARGGERIWFVNQEGQLAYLELADETTFGQVFTFPDLFLQEAGDLWNASVAPDEAYVALVSAYANDPTLYFFDGQSVGALELTPQSTQDGIEVQTIQYPDVVVWSPHPEVPRIAFDAYNEIELQTGALSYWSMYEVDFASSRIYNLLPAQPTGISVGNVAYSHTDPDVIVFNAFDDAGNWDVLLGDFSEGQLVSLDIPSFDLGGTSVTDAQRPTFAPDDAAVAFSSPSLGLVLFYAFGSSELSFLELGEAVYNPRWFMLGGAGGSQNAAPTARFTASTASGPAPLAVSFDASGSTDPNGDALTYRWTFGNGTVGGGVQTTHTFSAVGTYTVTLTVTDAGGLSSSTTGTLVVSGGTVADEDEGDLPDAVTLHANHPNPFNASTVVRFSLPAAADVDLTVYDLLGRPVATLFAGAAPAGAHTARFDAAGLPAGLYVARLRAGDAVQTRTLTLVR